MHAVSVLHRLVATSIAKLSAATGIVTRITVRGNVSFVTTNALTAAFKGECGHEK